MSGSWALPVLLALPLAGALLLLLLLPEVGDAIAHVVGLVVTGSVVVGVLALFGSFDIGRAGRPQLELDGDWIPAIGVRFHLGVDGISLPLVGLTALLFLLCMVHLLRHMPEPVRPRALVGLLLLLETGVLATFMALDLIVFFIAFEVVLLPMYFVIALWGGERRQHAATKFILFTLLGSVVMLVGFLVVGTHAGTFDLVELAGRRGAGLPRGVQDAAAALMILGLAVKTPVWPLHTWLPDAHTEAPTVGSVLLAGVLLKMGTYGLVRLVLPVVPQGAHDLAPALAGFAVIGIVWGSLVCLVQRDMKRLIAYSSVGHMGFVVLGIASLTTIGVQAALLANIAHGLITGLLFFLVGALKERHHSSEIAVVGEGMLGQTPYLGSLLVFAGVASLGLPGLAGFWGEALALFGAWRPAGGLPAVWFQLLVCLACLGAIITAAYFLDLLRRTAFGPVPSARRLRPVGEARVSELVAWTPLVVATVVIGLYPRIVLGLGEAAVRGVLGVSA
ncbi:MAG: NADH-quinone oxidoreductase subunit [Frankiales bacterium]|nr:NADH-quinone oxidoreductase subunit [Frankiales bacterium]MDX6273969.1 NADH-quinone oxidoreductase subunit [Frankiales bacterium]